MTKKRVKLLKRVSLVTLILGLVVVHFFSPRLISEIRNPVVGLIKRNKNVNINVTSTNASKLNQKEFVFNSFDSLKLSALLTYS